MELVCADALLGWNYTSEGKAVLLWTDTGTLCNMMGLLYYLLYKIQGECVGLLSYIPVMKP